MNSPDYVFDYVDDIQGSINGEMSTAKSSADAEEGHSDIQDKSIENICSSPNKKQKSAETKRCKQILLADFCVLFSRLFLFFLHFEQSTEKRRTNQKKNSKILQEIGKTFPSLHAGLEKVE